MFPMGGGEISATSHAADDAQQDMLLTEHLSGLIFSKSTYKE